MMNNGLERIWKLEVVIQFKVGFEALTAVVMKSTDFWRVTPCSPLKNKRYFGGTYWLHFQGRISIDNSVKAGGNSTLKMEVIYSYETSVNFQGTIWRYIREISAL